MSTMAISSKWVRQQGLSLIELMVSITIGLVLMIAITSAYLGSSNATALAGIQGRMNEDAQAALSILSQHIRMAGNNPRQPNYTEPTIRNPVFDAAVDPYAIRGCKSLPADILAAASVKDLTCSTSTNAVPFIAVRYEADAYNTVPTTAGVPTDCLGNALTAQTWNPTVYRPAASGGTAANKFQWNTNPATYYVADNRLFVYQAAGSSTSSLYCKGNSATPQPLVENIEDLQFVYGTAPSTGTMTVAGYLDADGIDGPTGNVDLQLLPDSAARWARVMTVKMCVQVVSDKRVGGDSAVNQYVPCFAAVGDPPAVSTDGFLRRTYYSTIVLRNRVPAAN